MADDRLRNLALKWGVVGLVVQLWRMLYPSIEFLWADIDDFYQKEKVDMIRLRFGQLKPPSFKFPEADLYLYLYLGFMLLSLAVVWWLGLRKLFRSSDETP